MKIKKKIERWYKDASFMNFVHRRMQVELAQRMEGYSFDPYFEELDEAFEYDDRYLVPLVEYLTCRLHTAMLRKDIRQREEGIWQVWFQVAMEGYYVQAFHEEFASLLAELKTALLPILHKKYIRHNPDKKK